MDAEIVLFGKKITRKEIRAKLKHLEFCRNIGLMSPRPFGL